MLLYHFGLLWEALDSVRRGGDEDLSEFASERTATFFHDYYLSADPQRVLEGKDYFGPDGKNRNQFCLRLQQTLEPFVFGDRLTKDDQKFRKKFFKKDKPQAA